MNGNQTRRSAARDRLVVAAAEVFYRNGFTASGVDTVTEVSGVSKPTLYSHFRSKSELVAAALGWQHECRQQEVRAYLDDLDAAGAEERIMAIFDWLAASSAENDHRGCAFLNAAAELASPADEEARAVAREHKAWWRSLLGELVAEAGVENPEGLAEELLLLLDGAFARVSIDRSGRPIEVARRVATDLLRQRTEKIKEER